MFNFRDWFSTKNTLVGRIACLRNKNIELEYQLSRKSLAFDKAIEDNALQHSFLTAQIDQLKAQLADARPSFTLPNGRSFVAENYHDDQRISIDICEVDEDRQISPVCAVEYEFDNALHFASNPGKVRTIVWNDKDDEPEYISYYCINDLDPETEQDYIDQVIQDQADRASMEDK